MSRAEREKQIEVLHELFDDVGMGILVDFRGMTVSDLTSFRTQLRDQEATFKVVKNRLCIRAVEGTPFEAVVEHFAGPVGILYTNSDPVGPAKVLADLIREKKNLSPKVGILAGKVISIDEIKMLANLPDRDTLVAQTLATCQAPASNFVRLMAEIPTSLVRVLEAVRNRKEAA